MNAARHQLERVGIALFGSEWKRAMAAALGPYRPRAPGRVQDSLIYGWASGGVPVPGWVIDALPMVARDRAAELNRMGIAARDLALELAGYTQDDLLVEQVRLAAEGHQRGA